MLNARGHRAAGTRVWCSVSKALTLRRPDAPWALRLAVGRSVFWEACTAYLEGRRDEARAVEEIAANYLHLIDLWQRFDAAATTRSATRASGRPATPGARE